MVLRLDVLKNPIRVRFFSNKNIQKKVQNFYELQFFGQKKITIY